MKNNKTILLLLITAIQLSVFSLALADIKNKIKTIQILMDSWGNGAPNLEISLPVKWKYEKYNGPDFDIHWLTDPNGNVKIGIYVGHHPQRIYSTDKITKRFVGNIEVSFYTEQRKKLILTQAIVDDFFKGYSGSGVPSLRLHIMINETKKGFTEKAFEYLKTLKIKKG